MTRRSKAPKPAKAEDGKALSHPILTEVLIVIIGALLRNLVVRALARGKIVHTEHDRKLLKTSPSRRVALLGAKYMAMRSVPGALLVGAGIVAGALIRGRSSK